MQLTRSLSTALVALLLSSIATGHRIPAQSEELQLRDAAPAEVNETGTPPVVLPVDDTLSADVIVDETEHGSLVGRGMFCLVPREVQVS